MKFRSNFPLSQNNRLRRGDATKNELDFLKCLALLMTILGTQAWIAGEAFNYGYWNAAHWSGPIISIPVQSVAFIGFIGPFYNWIVEAALLFCLGPYIALISVRSKSQKVQQVIWATSILEWLRKRFTVDAKTGKFAAVITWLAVALFGLTLFLAFWIVGAVGQGKKLFNKQTCELRASKVLRTTIKLADGSKVSGRILDRSEHATVIMDGDAIYVLTAGEKPQLSDSTSVTDIKCPAI
jgi:hypothetical protein